MNPLGTYVNGNYTVTIYDDGTKVRINNEDHFSPEFPECIDLKITNRCNMNCTYCHEDSTEDGDHADLNNLSFINTLSPYTEVAIGGGDPVSHPNLIQFLTKLRDRNIIANMTLNYEHFCRLPNYLKYLKADNLIHGIGVSVPYVSNNDQIETIKVIPDTVVHVINGVISVNDLRMMKDRQLKILILGYKDFRRGKEFHDGMKGHKYIDRNKKDLHDNIDKIIHEGWFNTVSFDNLAIEQLDIRNILSEDEFNKIYMGDDGQFTMYIDAVNRKFAKNSTSPDSARYDLMDDIRDMFDVVRV